MLYINELTDKFLYYLNCLNFVGSIIIGDLVVNNRSKKDIEDDLVKMKFDKRSDSFNYLLTIPIYNLTKEKFKEYKDLAKKYQKMTKESTRCRFHRYTRFLHPFEFFLVNQ